MDNFFQPVNERRCSTVKHTRGANLVLDANDQR